MGVTVSQLELLPVSTKGLPTEPAKDWRDLVCLPASADASASVLGCVRDLPKAFGARIAKIMKKLASSSEVSGDLVNSLRLIRKPGDTHDDMKWLGKGLQQGEETITPAALDSYGAPWVFFQQKYGYRYGFEEFPHLGLGAYMVGLSGSCTLVSWPFSATRSLGGSVREVMKMLDGLAPGEVSRVMSKHAKVVAMEVVCDRARGS